MGDIYAELSQTLAALSAIRESAVQAQPTQPHPQEPEPTIQPPAQDTDTDIPDPVDLPTSTELVKVDDKNAVFYSLAYEMWDVLAYDMLLSNATDELIACKYGIGVDELQALRDNKFFAKILEEKRAEVAELGDNASFVIKMRMIAGNSTQDLIERLRSPATNNKDFLAMFKTVTELARLGVIDKEDVKGAISNQTAINFTISGVPGLEHLVNVTPVVEAVTVEDKTTSDRM